MKASKKLLVLLDGSERSMETVHYVGKIEPFRNMQIVLFHDFSGVPECYWDLEKEPKSAKAIGQLRAWESQNKKKIEAYMEKAGQSLINEGFSKDAVEIKIHKRDQGVARDIINEAKKDYSAVVLRRRGKGVLERIAVGSVANKLIAKLTFLPVIIAGQFPPVKKILIAVDGSSSSIQTVELVGEYIGGAGYEVCMFHVIRGFGNVIPQNSDFTMPVDSVEYAKSIMTGMFDGFKKKLVACGFEPEKISDKIITGVYSRAGAIVNEAEEGSYSTIVMGRRGLSKVEEFFMGRVSNKVIHSGKKFSVWVI